MPLTVYEKNGVKGGMNAIVTGFVEYNVLNQPRTPKATQLVPNPKPEFVIALSHFEIKGDPELVAALKETAYADGLKISLRDKSPYAPVIFDKDNRTAASNQLIGEGKCIKKGILVHVHVKTFDTPLNVGCGFDALKVPLAMEDIPVVEAGGTINASIFDMIDNDDNQPKEWD